MQPPERLRVTREAIEVAVATYRVTGRFPNDERYGLTSQMRRAAASIGSNIAEGCGRDRNRELRLFLQHAMGSAAELEFQATLAARLGLGDANELLALSGQVVRVKKMLAKLIVAIRLRDRASSPTH